MRYNKKFTSKCSECHYSTTKNDMRYCSKRNFYPSNLFILAWGCDEYKDKYVNLLEEEENAKN